MKKIIIVFIVGMLLSSCGNKQNAPQSNVSNNHPVSESSSMQASDPIDSIKVVYKGNECAWDISQAELAERINSNLPDIYEKAVRLKDGEDRMWSNNGETWQFVITNCYSVTNEMLKSCAAKIELSTYAKTDEEALENAVYIEAAISAFHPDAVDYIAYETNLYGENTKAVDKNGLPTYPQVTYGDCTYEYQNANNKFVIWAHNNGNGTNLDNKGVAKPK